MGFITHWIEKRKLFWCFVYFIFELYFNYIDVVILLLLLLLLFISSGIIAVRLDLESILNDVVDDEILDLESDFVDNIFKSALDELFFDDIINYFLYKNLYSFS